MPQNYAKCVRKFVSFFSGNWMLTFSTNCGEKIANCYLLLEIAGEKSTNLVKIRNL